jgi:hypothetical protein
MQVYEGQRGNPTAGVVMTAIISRDFNPDSGSPPRGMRFKFIDKVLFFNDLKRWSWRVCSDMQEFMVFGSVGARCSVCANYLQMVAPLQGSN